jgi:hypothetical protein
MKLLEIIERNLQEELTQYVSSYNDRIAKEKLKTYVENLLSNIDYICDVLVVCDDRNNPPSVIDNNCIVCDIYYKEATDPLGYYKQTNCVTHFSESEEVLKERKRCLDIVNNTPLGYRSKEEHEVLEWFADEVTKKIKSGK